MLSMVVLALASVYDLVSSYLLNRTDYSIGIASLHLIGVICLLGLLSIILCLMKNIEFITAANLLFKEYSLGKKQGKLILFQI